MVEVACDHCRDSCKVGGVEHRLSPEPCESIRACNLVPMYSTEDVFTVVENIESETLIMRLWNQPAGDGQPYLCGEAAKLLQDYNTPVILAWFPHLCLVHPELAMIRSYRAVSYRCIL